MEFDFSKLQFNKAMARDVLEHRRESSTVGEQLPDEAIIELWQERAAIQATYNTELIHWHRENRKSGNELDRACELCAAADLAMSYGDYVLAIIQPLLSKAIDSEIES